MRVIAGVHKGRSLKAVPGKDTRPTSDKVKEAVFHKMGPFFTGGIGLDLFAGSGSLGIEALSRGIEKMICIDQSKQAIKTIRQNIRDLKLDQQCDVFRNDAFRALEILQHKKTYVDLVLMDPPYDKINYQQLLEKLVDADIVKSDGLIYIEMRADTNINTASLGYDLIFERAYNKTTKTMILRKGTSFSSKCNFDDV